MSVTVTFRRLSGKHNKLAKAAASLVAEIQAAMNAQVETAVDIMRSEPPPKAGSRYIRTHTYANSWRPLLSRASGGRLEAGISGNAVDPYGVNYTVAVGGDEHGEGQLGMHEQTGWPLAQAALEGRNSGGAFLTTAPPVRWSKRIRKTIKRVLGE